MILAINGTPARLINDQQMTTLFKSEPLIKMVVDRLGEADGGEEEDDDVFTEMTTSGGTSHVISVPYFSGFTCYLIRCVRGKPLQLCGGSVRSLYIFFLVPSSDFQFLQSVWRTSPFHFGCARTLDALLSQAHLRLASGLSDTGPRVLPLRTTTCGLGCSRGMLQLNLKRPPLAMKL
jgi:hypothetical protein